jgi:hypothetical protein
MLRRLAICLAFATWCFLNTWVEFAEGQSSYLARYDPVRTVAMPVVCLEILIAAVLFGAWELLRAARSTRFLAVHFLFLAACFVPAGIAAVAALRAFPVDLSPWIRRPWFWPVVFLAAALPIRAAIRDPRRVSHLFLQVFLWSWPVLLLVLLQAGRETLAFSSRDYEDRPLAAVLPGPPPRIRVVWIIFDELSQAIAFGHRPAGLDLPNFDRLAGEAFSASAAIAPNDATELSLPSLTLGYRVAKAIPLGPGSLFVRTKSRPGWFAWNSVPNVFDSARALGFNTAVAGWFHPYGRVLNRSLTRCFWVPEWLRSGVEEGTVPQSLPAAIRERARLQAVSLPLVGHLPGLFPGDYQRREKIAKFYRLLGQAKFLACDPSMGLVLLHLPVPHPPAIYSRSAREITDQGPNGYLDSVALADVTLGALRRELEAGGLWDRTAILVSADHGWRTALWRGNPEWTAEEEAASHTDTSGVPFLLKLPGQSAAVRYDRTFETTVTRPILLDILAGRLTDPHQIAAAIDTYAHRSSTQ